MDKYLKIIFIRHGETNLNTRKLTLKGIRQVKNALQYIKDEKISAIYCSPRTRALQTANILNSKFKAPLFIMKEFNERQQLTPVERTLFLKEFEEQYLNYNFQTDDFETCKDFIDRTFTGLQKIKSKHTVDQTVIIVAHSSTLYGINTFVNGIPKNNKIKWLQCNNGAVIKFYL